MKTLGLIGGISPESTAIYYRLLNEAARARLGPRRSAPLLIWSFDFGVIDDAYARSDFETYRTRMVEAGLALKRAGAEGLLICSNTSHLAADAVRAAAGLPLIHIVEALAAELERRGARRPLLLGTKHVMTAPFYRDALLERFGIETLAPGDADLEEVERIIFEELALGTVRARSRRALIDMIGRAAGADGVILGCTELSLILGPEHTNLPLFDTTRIHAAAASAFQLS